MNLRKITKKLLGSLVKPTKDKPNSSPPAKVQKAMPKPVKIISDIEKVAQLINTHITVGDNFELSFSSEEALEIVALLSQEGDINEAIDDAVSIASNDVHGKIMSLPGRADQIANRVVKALEDALESATNPETPKKEKKQVETKPSPKELAKIMRTISESFRVPVGHQENGRPIYEDSLFADPEYSA